MHVTSAARILDLTPGYQNGYRSIGLVSRLPGARTYGRQHSSIAPGGSTELRWVEARARHPLGTRVWKGATTSVLCTVLICLANESSYMVPHNSIPGNGTVRLVVGPVIRWVRVQQILLAARQAPCACGRDL